MAPVERPGRTEQIRGRASLFFGADRNFNRSKEMGQATRHSTPFAVVKSRSGEKKVAAASPARDFLSIARKMIRAHGAQSLIEVLSRAVRLDLRAIAVVSGPAEVHNLAGAQP